MIEVVLKDVRRLSMSGIQLIRACDKAWQSILTEMKSSYRYWICIPNALASPPRSPETVVVVVDSVMPLEMNTTAPEKERIREVHTNVELSTR